MAYDLKAVFSLEDRISGKIRNITRQMQQLNNVMRQVERATSTMNSAQQRTSSVINNTSNTINRNTNIVNSNTSAVINNVTHINRYSSAASRMTSSIQSQSSAVNGLKSQLLGIGAAYLSAQGLASGFGNFTDAADSYSNISARLANVNDGLQTQAQLQDKIFKASQRSRSSYDVMASSVAKLNLLAKDAFSSNNEAIKFTELMTKSFAVSGAGAQEMESGMYQLTQAMAAGKLQGDEFRSIMENAPLLAQAISKTAGVSMGALKEMSSEGTITSDLIKRSLFNAAEEIEEKFGNMPMTFSQAMTLFKSSAKRVFEPLFNQFIGFVNSKTFEKLESKALSFVQKTANGLSRVFSAVKSVYKVWESISPVVTKVAKVIGTFVSVVGGIFAIIGTVKLVGAAFLFITSPIGLVAGAITGIIFGFKTLYDKSESFRNTIDSIGSAFKAVVKIFNEGLSGYGGARNILEKAGLSEEQIRLVIKFSYSLKNAFDKVKGAFKSITHIFNGEHKASMDVLESAGFSKVQVDTIRKFGYSLKSAFDKVKNVISGVGKMLLGGGSKDLVTALGFSPDTAAKVGGFVSTMKSNISAFISNVKTKFGEVKEYISEKITQLQPGFERLKEAFSQAFTTVSSIITNAWSIIEPYLSGLWNILQIIGDIAVIVFNNVIAPAISFLVQLFSTLWSVAQPILGALAAGFEWLSGVIKFLWDNVLAPLVEFILNGVKNAFDIFSGALATVQGWFETLSGWISTAYGHVKDFVSMLGSVKIPDWVGKIGSGAMNFATNIFGGGKKDGSHFNGIGRIPFDNYLATLHVGERVLNRFEADQYDAIMGGEMRGAGVSDFKYAGSAQSITNNTINNTTSNNGNANPTQGSAPSVSIAKLADQIIVHEDADINRIADGLVTKILERRGATA